MDKEQIKNKANEVGNKVDSWAEEKAEKHNFTKTQVFVGVAIGVLAITGLCWLAGVL